MVMVAKIDAGKILLLSRNQLEAISHQHRKLMLCLYTPVLRWCYKYALYRHTDVYVYGLELEVPKPVPLHRQIILYGCDILSANKIILLNASHPVK